MESKAWYYWVHSPGKCSQAEVDTSEVWLLLATIVCLKKHRNICSLFPFFLSFSPDSTGHLGSAHRKETGTFLSCSPSVRESHVRSVVFPTQREQWNPELGCVMLWDQALPISPSEVVFPPSHSKAREQPSVERVTTLCVLGMGVRVILTPSTD